MVTKYFGILFFVIVALFPRAATADYVKGEIGKGRWVSHIVFELTGDTNYKKDGITVVATGGRVVPQAKWDVVQSGWEVRIDPSLVKTKQVAKSEGKTLLQVCEGSLDPRCVRKLASLNNIRGRQISLPLVKNIMALPTMVASSVELVSPKVERTEVANLATNPVVPAVAAVVPAPNAVAPTPHPNSASSSSSIIHPPPLLPSSRLSPSYNELWLIIGLIALVATFPVAKRAQHYILQRRMKGLVVRFVYAYRAASSQFSNDFVWKAQYDPEKKEFAFLIRPEPYEYLAFPNLRSHGADFVKLVKKIMEVNFTQDPFEIVPDISGGPHNPDQDGEWVRTAFRYLA